MEVIDLGNFFINEEFFIDEEDEESAEAVWPWPWRPYDPSCSSYIEE